MRSPFFKPTRTDVPREPQSLQINPFSDNPNTLNRVFIPPEPSPFDFAPYQKRKPIWRALDRPRFEWQGELGDGPLDAYGHRTVRCMAMSSATDALPRFLPRAVTLFIAGLIADIAYLSVCREKRMRASSEPV